MSLKRSGDRRETVTSPKGLRGELDRLRSQLAIPVDQQRTHHILRTTLDRPWTRFGFGSSWRKACTKAGVVGLTYHDLRGTAVTRLALAGCSEAEIATITGHSMKDVGSILDAHYLHRDSRLAESAIRKLEESVENSN
jgi:integrase